MLSVTTCTVAWRTCQESSHANCENQYQNFYGWH